MLENQVQKIRRRSTAVALVVFGAGGLGACTWAAGFDRLPDNGAGQGGLNGAGRPGVGGAAGHVDGAGAGGIHGSGGSVVAGAAGANSGVGGQGATGGSGGAGGSGGRRRGGGGVTFGGKSNAGTAGVTGGSSGAASGGVNGLTSLMLGVLVDEKKLHWDTRVRDVYPPFTLGSAALAEQLIMKNLLCACTGIPYDNLGTNLRYSNLSAENVLDRMRHLMPTTQFGETFQYSNVMIAAAGYIGARVVEPHSPMAPSYRRIMQRKLFAPLGMTRTFLELESVRKHAYAAPHDRQLSFEELAESSLAATEWISVLNPGGGAWSTVQDLSKYLLLELRGGLNAAGQRVISEENLRARWQPQAKASEQVSYGLGLSLREISGVRVLGHGGALLGYTSEMFFLPDHGVAAVLLTNLGVPNPLTGGVFRRKLLELLFDGRDEAEEDLKTELKTQAESLRRWTSKVELKPDPRWLRELVGAYQNELCGTIQIRIEGEQGIFDAGDWTSRIGRMQDGNLEKLVLVSPPKTHYEFMVQRTGDGVVLVKDEGQRQLRFVRVLTK